jgi:hypothetical protein
MLKNHETEKRGRGRPPSDTAPMQLRLAAELIEAIDVARRAASAFPSRQEIIKEFVAEGLKRKGFLK